MYTCRTITFVQFLSKKEGFVKGPKYRRILGTQRKKDLLGITNIPSYVVGTAVHKSRLEDCPHTTDFICAYLHICIEINIQPRYNWVRDESVLLPFCDMIGQPRGHVTSRSQSNTN